MKKGTGVLIAIVIAIIALFGIQYNSLVKLNEDVDGQWAQVENQLKRRADLIPNLTNTVKGYAKHEKDTFTELAAARSGIQNANSVKEFEKANDNLTQALSKLSVVVERYPELKADESFRDLRSNLEGSENRIAVERMRYNELVKTYNKKVKSFPQNIIAGILGFHAREYFQISEKDSDVPKVEF